MDFQPYRTGTTEAFTKRLLVGTQEETAGSDEQDTTDPAFWLTEGDA